MLEHCGFCGGGDGPFTRVEGVFTVLMCPTCLANRARGRGPYPELTDAELRARPGAAANLGFGPEGSRQP